MSTRTRSSDSLLVPRWLFVAAAILIALLCASAASATDDDMRVTDVNGRPASATLSDFSDAERRNARIEVFLGTGATDAHRADGCDIADLWNAGRCDDAIDALRALEASGIAVTTGISWRKPMPAGTSMSRWADTRIGDPRVGATQSAMQVVDDNIFVATSWESFGAIDQGWTLNMSTDAGQTWSEMYYFPSTTGAIIDIDIHGDWFRATDEDPWQYYLRVGYVWSNAAETALVNRFDATDGSYLDFTGFFGDTPDALVDIALDWYTYEVYHGPQFPRQVFTPLCIAGIKDDGVLRYEDDNGEIVLPAIHFDALGGLDLCVSYDDDYDLPAIFISYIGAPGHLKIWRYVDEPHFTLQAENLNPQHLVTTLCVDSGDIYPRILCAHEADFANGEGIRLWRGSWGDWTSHDIAVPGASDPDYTMPVLPTHSPTYAWLAYSQASGGDAFYTVFDYYDQTWTTPRVFNEYYCYGDAPLAMATVPAPPDGVLWNTAFVYMHRFVHNPPFYSWYPVFCRPPGPGGYCHAGSGPPYITHVWLGDIDSATGSVPGYHDYTNRSTTVIVGQDNLLTVETHNGATSCGAWIDWNNDLDFEDADEFIPMTPTPTPDVFEVDIAPPAHALLGATTMRLRPGDSTIEPCGTKMSTGGEVEDYTVIVVDYCPASGTCGQYISRVEFASMDNNSACDQYINYGPIAGHIDRGLMYAVTITIVNGYGGTVGGLWFDWNHDVDFFDAGEEIVLTPWNGPGPFIAVVTVPPNAELGDTRMRVRLHREPDFTWPCDPESFGEVEDYIVDVTEQPYCIVPSECDHYISRVELGPIDNPSDCAFGYADYTNLPAAMDIGAPTSFAVTVGNSNGSEHGGLWVDWNQDLDFDDPNESIPLDGSPGYGPYTASIIPPVDALPGRTRLRVRVSGEGSPPGPCESLPYGETEDYDVVIGEPTHCIGSGGCAEHIGRVELGDIDNTSSCYWGYENFTHLSTRVRADVVYDLAVTAGTSYPNDTCSVWIDWNDDGDFDDLHESIPVAGTPGIGPYTAQIVPRPEFADGAKRLRIRLDLEGPYGPCDEQPFGEVEDYTVILASDYCAAAGRCFGAGQDFEFISRVEIGTIDNTSSCQSYSDFSAMSTNLPVGVMHPITVSLGNSDSQSRGAIWADWNQDLDFDDAEETIPITGSPGTGPYSASITPPPTALLGPTRLRLRVTNDTTVESCGLELSLAHGGEVEDYTINVVEGSPCPADTDGDADVDTDDFINVLVGWGTCAAPCPPYCGPDTNDDCLVDTDDFINVLVAWGSCP